MRLLYNTLFRILRQHENWLDIRHLYTLAWMMVGLIKSERVSLTAWIPYVLSRAKYAQSVQRRFQRWLHNSRIQVHHLYAPLIQEALADWGEYKLYLALDTSMLWNQYCLIRISVIYRGRAVPIVWEVLKHKSSSVSYETYKQLLDSACPLIPAGIEVIFLADRGFADTRLLSHIKKLGWHFRIRVKKSFWVHRRGRKPCKVGRFSLQQGGQPLFLQNVYITDDEYGPVCLALAHCANGEHWYVVSDEPVDVGTFQEYGLRFDTEENFLDDKSNGFQLEDSKIRSAEELERLCMVLTIATLYLV
ncbi:transposase, partial [bacterium]|nr:transposase [bacterium]